MVCLEALIGVHVLAREAGSRGGQKRGNSWDKDNVTDVKNKVNNSMLWIRIGPMRKRIRLFISMQIPDLDSGGRTNADSCGSGSRTGSWSDFEVTNFQKKSEMRIRIRSTTMKKFKKQRCGLNQEPELFLPWTIRIRGRSSLCNFLLKVVQFNAEKKNIFWKKSFLLLAATLLSTLIICRFLLFGQDSGRIQNESRIKTE